MFGSCNFKYLKMEAERAGLYSSLQLSHGLLQCHGFLHRPGRARPLRGRVVGERQGGRQLQQGRDTAGTWGARPVGTSSHAVWLQWARNTSEWENRNHTPLRLISKASSLVCDSLLARMNMTTWSCVCSEMSLPLMSTTRSPSMSLGSLRPACKDTLWIKSARITCLFAGMWPIFLETTPVSPSQRTVSLVFLVLNLRGKNVPVPHMKSKKRRK